MDIHCSFCLGTNDVNRLGKPELMLSCARCGRSGHPTCLNIISKRLLKTVREYEWCCIECKRCEICEIKGDDVSPERSGGAATPPPSTSAFLPVDHAPDFHLHFSALLLEDLDLAQASRKDLLTRCRTASCFVMGATEDGTATA